MRGSKCDEMELRESGKGNDGDGHKRERYQVG